MSTVPSYARAYFECVYDKPWDPVVLRELFTSALQVHWENPQHHLSTIGSESLGCLQYAAVEDETVLPANKLVVAPLFTFDDKRNFQGVYVGVGPVQLRKLVVDNYAGYSDDNADKSHSNGASVTLLFRHVHRSPDTALLMAASTQVFLYAIREHLKGTPDFLGMDPTVSTEEKQIEKESERYFQVDLQWNFSFNYRVSVSLESHRLKKYGMSLSEID